MLLALFYKTTAKKSPLLCHVRHTVTSLNHHQTFFQVQTQLEQQLRPSRNLCNYSVKAHVMWSEHLCHPPIGSYHVITPSEGQCGRWKLKVKRSKCGADLKCKRCRTEKRKVLVLSGPAGTWSTPPPPPNYMWANTVTSGRRGDVTWPDHPQQRPKGSTLELELNLSHSVSMRLCIMWGHRVSYK